MRLPKFSPEANAETKDVVMGIILWALLAYGMSIYMGLQLPSALTVSATIILVFITGFYAKSTHQILEETRKGRKMQYIEQRLEKLYYPIRLDEDPRSGGFYEELRDQLGNFQYLGSEELRKELDAYLSACREGNGVKNKEHYGNIKKIVEKEIPLMIDELNKLSGYH